MRWSGTSKSLAAAAGDPRPPRPPPVVSGSPTAHTHAVRPKCRPSGIPSVSLVLFREVPYASRPLVTNKTFFFPLLCVRSQQRREDRTKVVCCRSSPLLPNFLATSSSEAGTQSPRPPPRNGRASGMETIARVSCTVDEEGLRIRRRRQGFGVRKICLRRQAQHIPAGSLALTGRPQVSHRESRPPPPCYTSRSRGSLPTLVDLQSPDPQQACGDPRESVNKSTPVWVEEPSQLHGAAAQRSR